MELLRLFWATGLLFTGISLSWEFCILASVDIVHARNHFSLERLSVSHSKHFFVQFQQIRTCLD